MAQVATTIARAGAVLLLAALTVAGCTGSSDQKPVPAADTPPPANYKTQIAVFLRTTLTERTDFHGAQIATPTLKTIGSTPHYVVCLKFSGHNERKDKVIIYLGDSIAQFVDSKPEQCADAVFQPYQDLDDMMPPK